MTVPRDIETAKERIKNGQCPICGNKIAGQIVMVVDPRLGKVLICDIHMNKKEKTDEV